jgi:hypothetical protein
MKNSTLLAIFTLISIIAFSQTPITAVNTTTSAAASNFTYSNAGFTYNWGLAPNNTEVFVNGFTAGGVNYTYASTLTGNVRLRRVDNAGTSGNFSLVWAEVVNSGSTYNMFPAYQNDMEQFFNNRIYNKGSDNFFDNTSSNSNNIERMDWILNSSYSTTNPAQVGFAVFERGAAGAHDPFCIAAITSLDGMGNPATYGNIVRVSSTNYGDPGPNVTYRILKAPVPSNLLDAGTGTQTRGGVIISLQNLGIASGQTIYGYSLFSSDLPVSATPADLVDYTNTTFFPTNTGNPGGIDLVAVTGIYIDNTILPVTFTNFSAVDYQNTVILRWDVENEISVDRYDIERSTNGSVFTKIGSVQSTTNTLNTKTYTFTDNTTTSFDKILYYRIKQYDIDGKHLFSKIATIKRNKSKTRFTLFPNPVVSTLSANIKSLSNQNVVWQILDLKGSRLLAGKTNLQIGNNAVNITEVDKLHKGAYTIKIVFENGEILSEKFIKQ